MLEQMACIVLRRSPNSWQLFKVLCKSYNALIRFLTRRPAPTPAGVPFVPDLPHAREASGVRSEGIGGISAFVTLSTASSMSTSSVLGLISISFFDFALSAAPSYRYCSASVDNSLWINDISTSLSLYISLHHLSLSPFSSSHDYVAIIIFFKQTLLS